MKKMSRGFLLASLGVMSVMAFGMTGTASATILFLPESHKFPYHMAGVTGKSSLETVTGGAAGTINSTQADVLLLALSPTLADVHIRFLHASTGAGGECTNTSESSTILVNLLAHLGLADPGRVPAVLMLVPPGFEFTCTVLFIKKVIKVRGGVIGTLDSPPVNGPASELLLVLFNQSKGIQNFTTFLLGNETNTTAFEETSIEGGPFEQSGQQSEPTLLHALPGEGPFLLILP